MTQLTPIVNAPYLALNGLLLSNDATTPNTKLDVAAGVARDSNNIMDMNLGNFLGLGNSTLTSNSATVLNFSVNGANGLDTGSIAASTFYFCYWRLHTKKCSFNHSFIKFNRANTSIWL